MAHPVFLMHIQSLLSGYAPVMYHLYCNYLAQLNLCFDSAINDVTLCINFLLQHNFKSTERLRMCCTIRIKLNQGLANKSVAWGFNL